VASQLVDAWRMSQEVNLFLLGKIPAKGLTASYSPRTRTVAGQFAHMHNVRLRWLGHAAPALVGEAKSFPKGGEPTKAELKRALSASAKTIERFLEESEASGKVRSWSGSPATFLGYLVAHEAHHRGLAMVALRTAGVKLGNDVVYGMWQWGMRRNLRGGSSRR
jgi:uncharacterized damage-inducible protein DinB